MWRQMRHYIKVLSQQNHVGKFLMSRLLFKSRLCQLLVIHRHTYSIRFYPNSMSLECWGNPTYFSEDERVLSICLKKGDVFVDVGANIGLLSLKAASLVGPTGTVYSIEPHPRIYRYLVGNVHLNRFTNVRALNIAIGDKESITQLTNMRSDDSNRVSPGGGIEVPISTLDRILANEVREIDCLKGDVEGMEKFVLLGARKVLQRTQCVYFETKEKNFRHYGYSTPELLEIMQELGFRVLRFVGVQLQDVPADHVSEHLANFLAVRDLDDFMERTGLAIAD